ncbi:MAG: hypothetical protein ACK6DP_09495 [Gemmatimonas sp.]|jgi:hypothetical protein|uniref:hypothetical protein n=1 Tax=Gemmatimonas sp. TaxID=1962908 RepID=UPI00391EE85D|nr:hypothetical protein [Gemmatimonadota bacterium]
MTTSLYETVIAFRRGIERYVKDGPHDALKTFPRGCCKTSALLLARYLAERGFGRADLVANGRRERDGATQTHAWLRLNGATIDITADQFGAEYPTVIVGTPAPLHATFSGITIHAYESYMTFSDSYRLEHDAIYAGIVSTMDTVGGE